MSQDPNQPPSSAANGAARVGVVVICHGRLAQELIQATHFIMGQEQMGIEAIDTGAEYDLDQLHRDIEAAIQRVDQGVGILILTDMYGGTPCNLGLAFLDAGKIEILTGVNLPMMLKLAGARSHPNGLRALAELLQGYGQRNIVLASDILLTRKSEEKKSPPQA